MGNETLAIIMAAGYGARMGNIQVPKVMLQDKDGRPFIEDALTFLEYGKSIDFAVLTRDEPRFESLNKYLADHPRKNQFDVLYQTTKPAGLHIWAILSEYGKRGDFFSCMRHYENVIILPGDHKLTSRDIDLEKLTACHDSNDASISVVFSKGWNNPKAHKDFLVLDEKGRIKTYRREKADAEEPRKGDKITTTGVWVLNERVLDSRFRAAASALGFSYFPLLSRYSHAYPYFIQPGWGGVRDTPDTIGK